MLIDLINGYKNIYSHVCIMVFHATCLYNGFSYKLLVCDGFYKNCLDNGFSYKLLVYNGFYMMAFMRIICTMVFIQILSMRWFLYTDC